VRAEASRREICYANPRKIKKERKRERERKRNPERVSIEKKTVYMRKQWQAQYMACAAEEKKGKSVRQARCIECLAVIYIKHAKRPRRKVYMQQERSRTQKQVWQVKGEKL